MRVAVSPVCERRHCETLSMDPAPVRVLDPVRGLSDADLARAHKALTDALSCACCCARMPCSSVTRNAPKLYVEARAMSGHRTLAVVRGRLWLP